MLRQEDPDALSEEEDVDAKDSNRPELCSKYVKDIYKYLRELEVGSSSNSSSNYRDTC